MCRRKRFSMNFVLFCVLFSLFCCSCWIYSLRVCVCVWICVPSKVGGEWNFERVTMTPEDDKNTEFSNGTKLVINTENTHNMGKYTKMSRWRWFILCIVTAFRNGNVFKWQLIHRTIPLINAFVFFLFSGYRSISLPLSLSHPLSLSVEACDVLVSKFFWSSPRCWVVAIHDNCAWPRILLHTKIFDIVVIFCRRLRSSGIVFASMHAHDRTSQCFRNNIDVNQTLTLSRQHTHGDQRELVVCTWTHF